MDGLDWEEIVARLEGLGLPSYQRRAVFCNWPMTWNNWARQTGKSHTFSLRRMVRGLQRGRTQIFLSAGARQSRELMHKLRGHAESLRVSFAMDELGLLGGQPVRALEAELGGRLRVIALPANPMTARGYSGDVFLDEFAMHRDDRAIWAALIPTLTRGGGELDVASTPHGRKNMFFRLLSNPRFWHSRVTIHEAVAGGLATDVEVLRDAMGDPLSWRQEFECEFVDEATAFLTHELITRCVDRSLSKAVDWERLGDRSALVYFGADVARRGDWAVIWLWEAVGDAYVTRGVIEMRDTSFHEQGAMIDRLIARPAVRRGAIDRTGLGMQLAEELVVRHGSHRVEPVNFGVEVKLDLAGRLRVLAERGLLKIPEDEAIRNDWHGIERIVTAGGNVRYDADRGADGHSDRFWAAALGLHAAKRPGGVIEYVGGPAARFAGAGAW